MATHMIDDASITPAAGRQARPSRRPVSREQTKNKQQKRQESKPYLKKIRAWQWKPHPVHDEKEDAGKVGKWAAVNWSWKWLQGRFRLHMNACNCTYSPVQHYYGGLY